MDRRILRLAAAFLCLLLFVSACSGTPQTEDEDAETPSKVSELPAQAYRDPFLIREHLYHSEELDVIYPKLVNIGTNTEQTPTSLVNARIEETVSHLIGERSIDSVEYDVYYNDKGVFSMAFRVYYPKEEVPYIKTLTFDCDTGELITIDRLFNDKNSTWRRMLPYLMTQISNMPMLSVLPPIDNDRMFYLTEDELTIVYQLYEITTYSYGTPRFKIKYENLQEYIGENSILLRITGD